jgi:hypothetical protein
MTAPAFCPQAGAVSISDASEPTKLILSDSQIFGGRLATVAHFFVAHLGTLIEAAQSRFFDGRDVHEDILAATIGLNKSIALSGVEPLHCTCCHVYSPIESKTRNDGDRNPAKERARQGEPSYEKAAAGLSQSKKAKIR